MLPPSVGEAVLRAQIAHSMAVGSKGASLACALQKALFSLPAYTQLESAFRRIMTSSSSMHRHPFSRRCGIAGGGSPVQELVEISRMDVAGKKLWVA